MHICLYKRIAMPRIIPISAHTQPPPALLRVAQEDLQGPLLDQRQRPLRDLRISVTDRCNFRCTYCMPKEVFGKDYAFLAQSELLSFEEIVQIARVFVERGVNKIRLTGGEPLLRKHLDVLIGMLKQLTDAGGKPITLALTTNGALLTKKAVQLKEAGLDRLTVSLDALDDGIFKTLNDVDFPVQEVLDGIQAAHEAGFEKIKINMVVKRGVNDQEVVPMARYFKDSPHILRFIEYMDVGNSNGWKLDEVLPAELLLQGLAEAGMPVTPLAAHHTSETASRWQHQGGGEIGLISSVSHAFCSQCSRARLSTQGKLYTCLFANEGVDLRAILRDPDKQNSSEEMGLLLRQTLHATWHARTDRYSEMRAENTHFPTQERRKIEMSYIGG